LLQRREPAFQRGQFQFGGFLSGARIDETIRKLELVRREELEAVTELAANARAGQEAAELKLAALESRLAALEQSLAGAARTAE
jgi:BMFP domain-containing protein YqiC